MSTNIVFFGSSPYSLIILEKLLTLPEYNVSVIVTKTDKPVGRDQTVTANPVAQFALDHHLNLLQIEEFTPEVRKNIQQSFSLPLSSKEATRDLALGLCVAFGPPFFDQAMIDLFPLGIINIHPSPLPKYRGATPGPWQIINGETTSAVTFFLIDLLPDHGPIIAQLPFDITPTETSASFYQKAFTIASTNLLSVLSTYLSPLTSKLIPQDHIQKSYYPKFTKDTAQIDWSWPEIKIDRFIRALTPWPIAWTFVRNLNGDPQKMKIFSSKFDQKLILDLVQIEGKKPVLWSEIKKYYQIITKK